MYRSRCVNLQLWAVFILLTVCSKTRSEDESVQHEVGCQDSVMKIRCLNRSFALAIVSAIYGRQMPGSVICPTPDFMKFSDEMTCQRDVYDLLKERCDDKMNCTIPIDKDTLNEPCPTVYKYLEVSFKCKEVPPRVIREHVVVPTETQAISFRTSIAPSRAETSVPAPQPTSTLLLEVEKLITDDKPSSTSSITSPPRTSSPSQSRTHSVSVSRANQPQFATSTIDNLRSTPLTSPSNPASKTTENKTIPTHDLKGRHGTMKLFHFILSFQIVRQEHLGKHPANSVVWFLCGVFGGLHIMIATLFFLNWFRRKRDGKPDKSSYVKQKIMLGGPREEEVELHPKKQEALEMESQFGETA